MAENKTRPTDLPAAEVVAAVEHPVRRQDAEYLLETMGRISGEQPTMWGPSIVGFGSYHYRYATGREGDAAAIGFAAQKSKLSLYGLTAAPEAPALLARLGKHHTGAGCLYINKLADVDLAVLDELITAGHRHMTTENFAQ